MKIGEKYEIKWLDTVSFNGWFYTEDLKKKCKEINYLQVSVGIFAGQDRNWVILVSTENTHEDFARWGHPNFIPKGCIKKIKKLK